MPMLVRLWMRARLDVARAWQAHNERPYFYAGPGKGAVSAAWKQAAWAELASKSRHLEYAVVLLDLVKAFERIQYWYLLQQVQAYGYSIALLRLSVASYDLVRVVGVDSVVAAPLFAGRGITAGSVFATIEMRLVMIAGLDRAMETCVRAMLTCFVDDVAVEMASRSEVIEVELVGAVKIFTDELYAAGMDFSPSKNVVSASTPTLKHFLAARLSGLRVRTASRVIGHGVGCRACACGVVQEAPGRLQAESWPLPRAQEE